MNIDKLMAADIIDNISEAHYNYYSSIKYVSTSPHHHDFYEIFLITRGSVFHIVNGVKFKLSEGSLVFIRPDDVHYYTVDDQTDIQFINIAFPQSTMDSILRFLENGFESASILSPVMPPQTLLNMKDKQYLQFRMEQLNLIPLNEKLLKRTEYRMLILEIITKYYIVKKSENELTMPQWMKHILNEIEKKENFTSGITVLIEISGKSHEHLCREFKKHVHVSPTEYVNNLKLNYAANLLSHTDTDIITISFEAGFGNVSHFNHLFKEKFGVSPSVLRKENRRSVIPESFG